MLHKLQADADTIHVVMRRKTPMFGGRCASINIRLTLSQVKTGSSSEDVCSLVLRHLSIINEYSSLVGQM